MGFPHEQTVACGDSGNDKDMLAGHNLAVVVGNAQPDMKEWIEEVGARMCLGSVCAGGRSASVLVPAGRSFFADICLRIVVACNNQLFFTRVHDALEMMVCLKKAGCAMSLAADHDEGILSCDPVAS